MSHTGLPKSRGAAEEDRKQAGRKQQQREEEIMAHIYIALVDTPGIFASMIRRFLRQKYIHVVISLDAGLEEAYSFGRRNPFIPLLAGFEKEDKRKILRAFPTADYMVYEIECSVQQKEAVRETLRQDMKRRYQYHYAVLGLFFLLGGRPFYQKNHYTCSSYIARVLEENGIRISDKHFSLVSPKDFYEYPERRVLFEGALADLAETDPCRMRRNPEAVYEV